MKPLHLAAASLALVLSLPASAQTAAPPPPPTQGWPKSWNTPTEPFRIIDNVYYVGTEGLGAYLFVTPEGHVLLDGATPEAAPLIEANIQKLGFQLSDVKYLLNSHAHFDHSGGLAQLKKDTGALLIASTGDQSALEGGFYLGSEEDKDMAAPPVKVDRAIEDGYQLKLGGRTFTAHLTPGHSRGCTSWGFEAKDGKKRHPGLVFCSASVAANRLVERPQYEGIVEDYRATFAKAARLKVEVFLAPHAEFIDLAAKRAKLAAGARPNPFIDPASYQRLIARQKAAFEVDLKKQRDAAAKAVEAKGP